jgi:hypothetical protein
MAGEALARLLGLDLPVRFLRGNGERAVLALAAGEEVDDVPEPKRATLRWVARRLDPEHRRLMARWPISIRCAIDGLGDVLFCHATPRSDTEIFTRSTPEDRLLAIFESANAALVVCGHTHMQFDRQIGRVRVGNAGSVGMPFGDPGAYWLLLGPDVELRHTRYDLKKAAERVRATDYPQASDFAERSVLLPSSEQEMLDVFTRAQLK